MNHRDAIQPDHAILIRVFSVRACAETGPGSAAGPRATSNGDWPRSHPFRRRPVAGTDATNPIDVGLDLVQDHREPASRSSTLNLRVGDAEHAREGRAGRRGVLDRDGECEDAGRAVTDAPARAGLARRGESCR